MPVSINRGANIASVIRLRVLFSIFVESSLLVRLVHQLDWVTDSQIHSCEVGARADVHLAAGVAGSKYSGIRLFDVGQLFIQDALRHIGLDQVVDTGGAATSFGAAEWDKVFTGNGPQHSFRRFTGALSIQKVT